MSFKSFLKLSRNLFFTSVGLSLLSLIESNPADAAPCPAKGSTAAEVAQTATCTTTPKVMDIKFYELGFCTGDPLTGDNFDDLTCEKAWQSTSGVSTDLSSFNYVGLTSGLAYKVPSKRYDYAYVIFDPTWGLKGEVYFNDKTYYTDVNGAVKETSGDVNEAADYSKFQMKINAMSENCAVYSQNTDYGQAKARLTNTNLVTATNQTLCDNATRMVGSVELSNPIVVTDNVKAYQLTWIIRDMGIEATDGGASISPVEWKGGPFIPNFTLLK